MTISSMTGYGASHFSVHGFALFLEIKSYNHRFCDAVIRAPKFLGPIEMDITKMVRSQIGRGRVEIMVALQEQKEKPEPYINLDLAKKYYEALQKLERSLGISEEKSASHLEVLVSFREIFQKPDEELSADQLWEEFQPGLMDALENLKKVRREEGESLKNDLLNRLKILHGYHRDIEKDSRNISEIYQEKMRTRLEKTVADLNLDSEPDEWKLVQEAAYLADRNDITEELMRFKHHLTEFERNLNQEGFVGRRLDFLSQEINREINTIGSKTGQLEVSQRIIDSKAELERIREQVQNIE